jgi:phosphoglycolate phosphatase
MSRLNKSEAASDFAVLFDLEDTLVQTPWSIHDHVLEFRRNTRNKLLALGVPAEILEGVERATIMRNKAQAYVGVNFNKTKTRRFQREMEKFLRRYELDSARKSRLFPDCVSTLETLRRLGAKLGLVTNTSKEAVAIVFQIHGLESFFDVTVTRENVRKLKPDPEGILFAAKKLDVARFFMVGDLILDLLAAKGAGGVAIIIKRTAEKSNFNNALKSLTEEILSEIHERIGSEANLQPDYTVQSLSEIPLIIQAEKQKILGRYTSRHCEP